MRLNPASRDLTSLLAAVALVFGTFAVLIALEALGSVKVTAGLVGAGLLIGAAYFSGNLRLFCLWGLLITIPFDLSKRFGPFIQKMGGENSFRIEMCDPFLLVLVVYIGYEIFSGRRQGLRVPKVVFIWAAIALMGCAAVFLGPWRTTAAHEVFRMIKMTVLFLVIVNEMERPKRFMHAAGALTLGVLIQAVAGLYQYFTKSDLGLQLMGETGSLTTELLADSSVTGESVHRVGAFLAHPNIFGGFLATLLPVAIGMMLLRIGKVGKLFFLTTVVLGMMALIASLSRSGWVSLAAAFLFLIAVMIMHSGLRRRSVLAGGAACVALLVVCAIFIGPITQRVFGSREDAMRGRAEYNRDALGMIAARPIVGWGLNSYAFAVPPFTQYGQRGATYHYKNWIPPVHNIYYLWMSETGVIGLILYSSILIVILYTGFLNLRIRDETMYAINAVCLAGIVAFVVDGFFSFTLRINATQRVFWVLAGIIMAAHYWRQRQAQSDSDRPVLPAHT